MSDNTAEQLRACTSGGKNGACRCKPGCQICGHGPHASIHLPAYKNGKEVRGFWDHAYFPKKDKSNGSDD